MHELQKLFFLILNQSFVAPDILIAVHSRWGMQIFEANGATSDSFLY